jgi:chromosome partitioning protein
MDFGPLNSLYAQLQLACSDLERACMEMQSFCSVETAIVRHDEMRTVAIVSQKGGAGKTTLAVHLAVAAQLAGFRCALVDLDPLASARKWADRRQAPEPEVVDDHAERLPQLRAAARSNAADLLLIDTAPNADRASLAAARAADLILIPCRPAALDLEAIETTCDLAAIAAKPAFVVLSAAPVRASLVDDARAGLEEKGARVAPQTIYQRVAYAHSVIDGRTAIEFEPDGKAAAEMVTLFSWMCQTVDLSKRCFPPEGAAEIPSLRRLGAQSRPEGSRAVTSAGIIL